MNILTTKGYINCIDFENFRALSSYKETVHFRLSIDNVCIVDLLNGLRITLPANVVVETTDGIVKCCDLKFGHRLITYKAPCNLELLKEKESKKRMVSEDAWHLDFFIDSFEDALSLYLQTGCCLKIKRAGNRFLATIVGEILNEMYPEESNIDKEREFVEIVKDIKIVKDICLKTENTIDHWTKLVINGCVCYNHK